MSTAKTAGMIGLGAMGMPMARHMADKGFTVVGFDVDAGTVKKAEGFKIRGVKTAAEVGKGTDVVVIMVATDKQVREVIGGGLLDTLAEGSVICIASSTSPETCAEMEALAAKKGIGVLDTPVVLGQKACDEGVMTVYVGGEKKWFDRAQPALQCFGKEALRLGKIGHGQIAKTMNNLLLWAIICANQEVLTLGKSLGADIPKMIEAMGKGSGANSSISRWGESTGKWAEKDLDVALDIAQKAKVPMPLSGLVDQLVKGINQEKMRSVLK